MFFLEGENIASVSFADHPAVRFGDPQILFSPDSIRGYVHQLGTRSYDPAADGEHFVVVTEAEIGNEEPGVLLLENWQVGTGSTKNP